MTGRSATKWDSGERVGGQDFGMEQVEELLKPQQLSRYLGIPVATLYAWRQRGQGPASFRVGKHLRYRRSDVARWIGQQIELETVSGS